MPTRAEHQTCLNAMPSAAEIQQSQPQPILCKSDDLTGVFNSCCVLGRAKCGVYKPKWVDYKPYWGKWEDGTNFVASLWTSGRADCEVDAGIYEI